MRFYEPETDSGHWRAGERIGGGWSVSSIVVRRAAAEAGTGDRRSSWVERLWGWIREAMR